MCGWCWAAWGASNALPSHVQVRSVTPEARGVAVAVLWLVSPMELGSARGPRGRHETIGLTKRVA